MEFNTLKKLALMRAILNIYESPKIRHLIRMLFTQTFTVTGKPEYSYLFQANNTGYQNFQLIIQLVFRTLNSNLELPLDLKNCQKIVQDLGERIYDWTKYINSRFYNHLKCYEKISWTSHGTIDEVRTFKMWESDEEFLKESKLHLTHNVICSSKYVLNCITSQTDFIESHMMEYEKIIRKFDKNFNLNNYTDKVYNIMATFLGCYFNHFTTNNINHEGLAVSPETMFQLTAFKCLPKAARYFWNAIKDFNGDQESSLRETSKKCVGKPLYMSDGYQKTKLAEVMNFLISQMTVNQREEFFQHFKIDLFWCLLPNLATNETQIKELIDNYFGDLTVDEYQTLAHYFVLLIYEKEGGISAKYHARAFNKIFSNLPNTLKKEIFNDQFYKQADRLFLFRKIECLILIMNVTDRNYMSRAIQDFQSKIFDYVQEGKIEHLDLYMKKILLTDDERNSFKEKILSSLQDILLSLFDQRRPLALFIIDNLLDYFSSSAEDRTILKNTRINCLTVCEKFIIKEWRYDKAENFLEWMFDSQEKRDQFRDSVDDSWFIRDRYWYSFKESLSSPREYEIDIIRDYYEFFFGYPEEGKFMNKREEFYSYREKLMKHFLWYYEDRYKKFELNCNEPQLFKWICKSEITRSSIIKSYRDDYERASLFEILKMLMYMGSCNSLEQLNFCAWAQSFNP